VASQTCLAKQPPCRMMSIVSVHQCGDYINCHSINIVGFSLAPPPHLHLSHTYPLQRCPAATLTTIPTCQNPTRPLARSADIPVHCSLGRERNCSYTIQHLFSTLLTIIFQCCSRPSHPPWASFWKDLCILQCTDPHH